jgi:curved DNA-binding protein CbpA
MKDLYKILGVSRNISDEDLKKTYHNMGKEYHPDQFSDPIERKKAEAIFKSINNAYEILGNKKARAEYDQLLKRSEQGIDIVNFVNANKKETYHQKGEPRKTKVPSKSRAINKLMVAAGISVALAVGGCSLLGSKTGTPKTDSNSDTISMDTSTDNNTSTNTADISEDYDFYTTLDEVKTIEAGDTLSAYALKYGTSVEELEELNNLSNDKIEAGKTIIIPHYVSNKELDQYTATKDAISGMDATTLAEANHTDAITLKALNKEAFNEYGRLTTSKIVVPNFSNFTDTKTTTNTNSNTK